MCKHTHGELGLTAAAEAGADWAILQPPPVRGMPEAEYIRFFGAVAEGSDLPIAVQNAPQYIGIGLSNRGLATLRRNPPETWSPSRPSARLWKSRASSKRRKGHFES